MTACKKTKPRFLARRKVHYEPSGGTRQSSPESPSPTWTRRFWGWAKAWAPLWAGTLIQGGCSKLGGFLFDRWRDGHL